MAITPYESELLVRYLARVPAPDTVIYQYQLPDADRLFPSDLEPTLQKMILTLEAKKIDAVLTYPAYDELVEVKPRLVASHLGQLLVYKNLYTKKIGYAKSVRLIAVFEEDDLTLHPAFAAANIQLVQV